MYTIDTPTHPASLFGVKDLAVDYLSGEYEIPELREGPSQIVTRAAKSVALWHPVEFLFKNRTTQKFPGRIQQNKSGKIVFRFRPVVTRAIRIAIYDTNDSVLAGSRGYGYGTQDRKGIIRIQEIEVYGLQKVSTPNKVSGPKSTSASNLNGLTSKVTASTNPQKEPAPQKMPSPPKEKDTKEKEIKDVELLFRRGSASTSKEEKNMNNANFFFMRGNAYGKKGRYDRAIADYSKALEINPNFALAYNNLAWLYVQKGENLNEALNLAKKAVELDESNGAFFDTLGYVYYKMGNYEAAEKEILWALALSPTNEEIQEHLKEIQKAKSKSK